MTLFDINALVFDLFTNIAALLLTPPYYWFTALFVIGAIISIIHNIINFSRR